jgi:hypothetical protein
MYSIGKKEFDMMGKMQVRYKNRRTLYEMQEMAVMYVQDGGALEGTLPSIDPRSFKLLLPTHT